MARLPAFVLVHGLWHGGWCYRRVAERLLARGHRVFAPSLTGLADRSHLLSPAIRLQTHIDDIANLVLWEDLDPVVLCGHSYAGMVITGVAEAIEPRIHAMVYLDAFVPEAGRSLMDHASPPMRDFLQDQAAKSSGGAYVDPVAPGPFVVNERDRAWVASKCTRHPYAPLNDSLSSVSARERVPARHFVRATNYRAEALSAFAEQCRRRADWRVWDLPFGHDLMIDAPQEVCDILLQAGAVIP